MRRMLCTTFVVCMFALVSAISVPAVQAKPVMNVDGTLTWLVIEWPPEPKVVGHDDKITIMAGTSTLELTGTFAGAATDVWAEMLLAKSVYFRDVLTIPCTIDGKSGTLTILLVASWHYEDPLHGQWTIMSGTDDLANLNGTGTWYAGSVADVYEYSGFMLFE